MPNLTSIMLLLVVAALWVRWYFHPMRREAFVWGLLDDLVQFRRTWRLHWAIVRFCDGTLVVLLAGLAYRLLG